MDTLKNRLLIHDSCKKKKQCTNIIGHLEHIRDPMISLLIKLNLSTCLNKQKFFKRNWSRSRADFPSQHIQILVHVQVHACS